MRPLDKLTDLETGQQITVTDEHHNSYTGEFVWDSEEEVHKLDELKLVADYDRDALFIVKPIDDEKIEGFLAEITQVRTNTAD